uniref:IS66 family transposase n=1 Tax=Candidatus Ventrimonas sp. TaxID=3048889 RepID=UPI003FEE4506
MGSNEQIRLLQAMIEQQKAYIQMQEARMAEKDATIADLRKLVDELQSLKANLEETLKEFRRQFFGISSEKTSASKSTAPSSGEALEEEPKRIEVKSHTRERKTKSRRKDIYADLPVKEVAICPECRKDGDGTFVKSTVPMALMAHSPASPSAVAYVMFHKTFIGTPYYRQEAAMFQMGLKLPRETMANWCIYCAEEYFYPIYERMHELLLKRDIIHGDETTCQVLREKGKAAESTSYMWIYLSGSDGLPPIVLYDYQPGRGGTYAKNFLEGFTGLLQCDGYQGYNKVEDVILVCCLAHCRRKFYEAVPAERRKKLKLLDIWSAETIQEPVIPEEAELPKMIPAEVGLSYCNKLFFIERELKDLPADARKEKRLEKETPIWDDFWKWLEGITPAGGSKLEKAVNYARNHRETLCNYLLDGRCEISNNAAERRAKSYAIGRKAFLFHTSEAGAGASAVMYSIIETAKSNNLNVFQYLYMVLLYMPDYKNESAGIEMLLPWSDFIKEHCSGLIDVENITPEKHDPLPI